MSANYSDCAKYALGIYPNKSLEFDDLCRALVEGKKEEFLRRLQLLSLGHNCDDI